MVLGIEALIFSMVGAVLGLLVGLSVRQRVTGGQRSLFVNETGEARGQQELRRLDQLVDDGAITFIALGSTSVGRDATVHWLGVSSSRSAISVIVEVVPKSGKKLPDFFEPVGVVLDEDDTPAHPEGGRGFGGHASYTYELLIPRANESARRFRLHLERMQSRTDLPSTARGADLIGPWDASWSLDDPGSM